MDRDLCDLNFATCRCIPAPAGKWKLGKGVNLDCNQCFFERRESPSSLKKYPSLPGPQKARPGTMNNYYPIYNLLFLEKVEQMVRLQLQRALEETDYLNTWQSGFRPGHGKETALVSLTGMKGP